MVSRTVDEHKPPFHIIVTLKNVCANEKGALPPESDFETFISNPKEEPTRVPRRRNPIPVKLAPMFQPSQFLCGEVLLDGFLQANNVYPTLPESILKLCAPPWRIPAPDILDQEPH
jgi:hypothetical protein